MSKRFQIAAATVILGIIVVLALPSFFPAHITEASGRCLNNLRQLDGATYQWALENGKTTNDTPSWQDLRPYLGPKWKAICEHGGTYALGRMNKPPTCSYPGHSIQ